MTAVSAYYFTGVEGRNELFHVLVSYSLNIESQDGNDVIFTYNGNDRLAGGLGRDLIVGNAGDDFILGDRYAQDEVSSLDQTLSAAADAIGGGAGNDIIFAGGGSNFVHGGAGDDYVVGGNGKELLVGGTGNDQVFGGGGDDILCGGSRSEADQTAFVNANIGTIIVNFNGFDDSIFSKSYIASEYVAKEVALTNTGNDYLDGGAGNDTIYGQDGADTLLGGAGNDILDGGVGADTIDGGSGTDTLSYRFSTIGVSIDLTAKTASGGDAAGDKFASVENLDGSAYGDRLYGSAGNNVLKGLVGNDSLKGRDGNDTLYGGDGNDSLFGDAGDDTLKGEAGDDKIYGGLGKDVLFGASGKDTFVFDTAPSATNIDTIDDFVAKDDTIVLDDDIFTKAGAVGHLGSEAFYAGTKAHDADDRVIYDKTTGKLWYDYDGFGKGAAVQFALLDKNLTLSAADFDIVA